MFPLSDQKPWLEILTFLCPGLNNQGHIVFVLSDCLFVCLSVCLFVVNFNIRYNFWILDRDFNVYLTNNALSNDTKVNDLVTLTLSFVLNLFLTLLLPGHSVSQTLLFLNLNCIVFNNVSSNYNYKFVFLKL